MPPSSSNPKATFSDGTPMTAEDVEYTFRRGIEGTQYTKLVMGMLTLSSAKNIEIVDKQTIRFKLDKSNPMTERLMNLQVMSLSEQEGRRAARHRQGQVGRRVLARERVRQQRLHAEGLEPRRGLGARAERQVLPGRAAQERRPACSASSATPQERLNLLKSGTLHVAYEVPAKDAAAIRDDGDGRRQADQRPSPWSFGLTFNNSKEPFKDKRVRQALSYAIPYDAIIDDVMYGLARPAKSMVPPGMATHDPSAWKYDTDLAEGQADARGGGPPRRVQEQHRRADRAARGRAGGDR